MNPNPPDSSLPYPADMLEPIDLSEPPTDDPEFRRELARVLNRWGVDSWAEIPDHILADVLAQLIAPIRWGRIATAKWMGQPLLSEKLAASLRRDPGEIPDNPFPPGDPRGLQEYQACISDLCAVQRRHTTMCLTVQLEDRMKKGQR
jgi:hypothetical protein